MKLNYRDKIVLGILLAVVILVAAFFALIKPKMADIKENKAELERVEARKQEIERLIAEIPGIKENITKIYKETNGKIDIFVKPAAIENARLVDQYMQKFAVENEVQIQTLQCSDMSTSKVDYYYFTKEFAGEDILRMADLNGERIAEHRKQQAEQIAVSARTVETVLSTQYSINVKGDREHIWKYMEAIEAQKETMIINSVGLVNIDLKEDPEAFNNLSPQEKEERQPSAQFVLTLYSLYDLSEPNLE